MRHTKMYYTFSAPGSLQSRTHFNIHQQQSTNQCDTSNDTSNLCVTPERKEATGGVGWHVMLARLLVQLRTSIPEDECESFDLAHSRALRREIPLPDFFSYCLARLRVYAPLLEPQFREVFRLRNESRRRKKSISMSRSISAPSGLNTISDEIVDGDLEFKLSRLCVKPDVSNDTNSCFKSPQTPIDTLGKRNSEDLDGDMIRRIMAKSPPHPNRIL